MTINAEVWLGSLSLLVLALGALSAWTLGRRSELGYADWLREVRAWSADALATFGEARFLVGLDDQARSSARELEQCIIRFSIVLDRGRFYLPNRKPEREGDNETPVAYRGYRNSALDPLMAAMRVLRNPGRDENVAPVLFELQREFVSEIYLMLRPDQYNRRITRATQSGWRAKEKELLSSQGDQRTVPSGDEVLINRAFERVRLREKS